MGNIESTHGAAAAATNDSAEDNGTSMDEPWWHEIEHENLVLEQAPPTTEVVVSRVRVKENQTTIKESTTNTESRESNTTTMDEFKEQMQTKRLERQTAVQELRDELTKLREQLATEQAETRRLRELQSPQSRDDTEEGATALNDNQIVDEDDENPSSRSRHANIELAKAQLALQLANADNLSLRGEVDVVQRQVGTLKEVIACCKQMLHVKEEQCDQLKSKLQEIETSFSEREMKIMSNNLRQEYERQLVNIRQLRQLYEERQRVAAAEYENLQRLISIKKDELIAEQEKTKNFEERNQALLHEVEVANNELAKVREECSEHTYEKRTLKEQMAAVNLLFSQMVMGFNGTHNMDIDRLTQMLEENRGLLNEMMQAEGSCSDGATLPKLLFDLVEQATPSEVVTKSRSATPTPTTPTPLTVDGDSESLGGDGGGGGSDDVVDSTLVNSGTALKPNGTKKHHRRRSGRSHEPEIMGKVATAQEIIGNLPKVWKVLMELLSHHKIERVPITMTTTTTATTTGTTMANGTEDGQTKTPELSVSKMYIKLKDLILEKKSLVKETNRLKTLNCHLDARLNEQEKRLSVVSLELTKTWHLVGKMQRQHRQLHTQEQILRYQLQQKRRLLNELKDELEYCRRKWALARAKNDESQEQCDDWRREFARRKLEDANHSAESGYSDSGPQSDEELAVGGAEVTEDAGSSRRKHLRDQFEHTRKIKRMQSTSPGRQAAAMSGGVQEADDEIVLRWNSAPPTCGWREGDDDDGEDGQEEEEDEDVAGAIAKVTHMSRSKKRNYVNETTDTSVSDTGEVVERASRIQRLEEQCKSLIQQVLETSGNRERLEIQLCRFQDEIAPVQHAVPLEEFINRKRFERMTRASSAPATGSLTPREEEYTRKRSERLERLEEESRQLMSRIKRTTDRGHYLRKSLDRRIRRGPSREGSFESNTEEEANPSSSTSTSTTVSTSTAAPKREDTAEASGSDCPLSAAEVAYTARRAERLQRLEMEGQQLLAQLSNNSQRGEQLATRLQTLHERHDGEQVPTTSADLSMSVEQRLEDIERISVSRAERLRRLEAEGNELIARLSSTSERGTAMINRIAERESNRRQEQVDASSTSTTVNNVTESTVDNRSVTSMQQSTGAIPKTRTQPTAQLCAATRQEDATKKRTTSNEEKAIEDEEEETAPESLEKMVQRLRSLPFPTNTETEESQETQPTQPTQTPQTPQLQNEIEPRESS